MSINTTHNRAGEITPAKRPIGTSMARGARLKCPNCAAGALSEKYLKINDHCDTCGEALHHHSADDAPPYFTMFIVGHLIIPPLLFVERTFQPNVWLQVAIWLPLSALLCALFLPRVKGALVGLQWALRMGGFSSHANGDDTRFGTNGTPGQTE